MFLFTVSLSAQQTEEKSKKKKVTLVVDGNCEMCKNTYGTDVHHLQYQNRADKDGFIGSFHKNKLGNLINICKACHDKIHREKVEYVKQKTNKGFVLKEL